MKKSIRIFLTGGLGNQLFQFAAALHYANGRKIELDINTANPRLNSKGIAELLTLNLPTNLSLVNNKRRKITQKIFGYNLRSGYLPKHLEKTKIFQTIRNLLSSLILSFLIKKPYQVHVAHDLGYDPLLLLTERNEILIGYFQTYKVTENLEKLKDLMFINVGQDEYSKYKNLVDDECPLLVHVRLGDYKIENQFGVLSNNYYTSAINALWNTGKFKKIWLFSDENEKALTKIPEQVKQKTRVISSDQMESAEILRIMTLCKGFIIGNSTFSWWAAQLRENLNAPVIAPKPWFKNLSEPNAIIPIDWKRLDAF